MDNLIEDEINILNKRIEMATEILKGSKEDLIYFSEKKDIAIKEGNFENIVNCISSIYDVKNFITGKELLIKASQDMIKELSSYKEGV